MKIGTNRNQVSSCCAEDVMAAAFIEDDATVVYCSACKDNCEVEILSDSLLEERHALIAEQTSDERQKKTMVEAVAILQSKQMLDAWFEGFDATINVVAYEPDGQKLSFVCGTANDRFDIQWHLMDGDQIDGECRECANPSVHEYLPLDVEPKKLARWIRANVCSTICQHHSDRISAAK